MSKKVFLGMSGGVDSSVSALLLRDQGYDVTGIYMKNWSEDLPGMHCPWAEDLADAKRVATSLDLDFEVWDFEADYKTRVVDYMLSEFQKGHTPNPDVVCNELVKFKLFYDRAIERGADYIATGHYARAEDASLLRAVDENKDQTYFLYRMSDEATARTLFPIGHLTKPEVKKIAAERGLDVATKKESMGICFVGEVGIKDFLSNYLKTIPGEIREVETDQILGYHDGAIFYTIGQRHGLYLGGGLPYYVVKKDLSKNLVYVSRDLNHPELWADQLALTDLHLRNGRTLADLAKIPDLTVRLRHRGELLPATARVVETNTRGDQCSCEEHKDSGQRPGASSSKNIGLLAITFANPVKRPASGQSAVLYAGEVCLGGGYIA
jgi:tRNA-specific 2-thiouridylase